ncbi:amino acid ABC transporter ATP-binding protein [Pseudomonas putida]|uniref:amino acid ABC transporter ATP-binding protein n=1 Tax=Pseudomonas putida TaxID=303 RepID=UPI002364073F|nr:amino acid ABC transporter ATP-binding protein [Pseudomonas putida]MDD2002090.1 amino acid ABC transporter ATP-binding protein [Pseudomonas putida]
MQKLKKWYANFAVLNGVDFEVKKGERVVICGPSGSGKSTLIRCINGLERFQEGRLVVNGTELGTDGNNVDIVRRETGMVFQGFHLFPHLSALENCMLAPMRVLKQSKAEAKEQATALLERVGLGSKTGHYPSQLSGGQQQRVAIARALCMNPQVMLLDEPTSALDPEMVKEVLDVVLGLAESGITLLCVTHEMGFARQAADRVVFMDRGEIIEQAPPLEFFGNPQSDRAKKFLSQILGH